MSQGIWGWDGDSFESVSVGELQVYDGGSYKVVTDGWVWDVSSQTWKSFVMTSTVKVYSDALAPVKTTVKLDLAYYARAKTAALVEGWTVTTAARGVSKAYSDALAPVKTTAQLDSEFAARAKTAALVESWTVATAARGVSKTYSDALAPSKTTAKLDISDYARAKTAAFVESWTVTTAERGASKTYSDALAPSKTTANIDSEFAALRAKTAAFTESWTVTTAERGASKTYSDALAPSKTTNDVDTAIGFARAKIAAFTESWTVTTAERGVSKTYNDALAPSKTTNDVDLVSPRNLVATHDLDACPTLEFDLAWLNNDATATLTVERRDTTTWTTLTSSLTAGSTAYTDSGAQSDTNRYRIKLNVYGAPWVEDGVTNPECVE
jgi:hypothetical protein